MSSAIYNSMKIQIAPLKIILIELKIMWKQLEAKKGYSVDNAKSILELASRLRVLLEMKIQFSTEINRHTHIEKVLEALK